MSDAPPGGAYFVLVPAAEREEAPLGAIATTVLDRFVDGAATAEEVPQLRALADALAGEAPIADVETRLRALSRAGFLRGAIVVLASALHRRAHADVALVLARELLDAIDPELGSRLARAVLLLPQVQAQRTLGSGAYAQANLLLGEALLERGDRAQALRHFEAVLAFDIDHRRALRGWGDASRGAHVHRRGLGVLDGVAELEVAQGFGSDRYEIGRPLGRGRHAIVYQAWDRRVGREVALKRLLQPDARSGAIPTRVLEGRFFAEARTLAHVRDPHVVALLDVQPRHGFIALELCSGGNLRLALRRGLVGPADLPRVARELRAALHAVHAAGAVHRDVKPANILVRAARPGSPIALADFGLAVAAGPDTVGPNAGTLRYLAPELRGGAARATPASDRFSAAVVLLELARYPLPLPDAFDRAGVDFDAVPFVPEDLPTPWTATLRSLLGRDPLARTW